MSSNHARSNARKSRSFICKFEVLQAIMSNTWTQTHKSWQQKILLLKLQSKKKKNNETSRGNIIIDSCIWSHNNRTSDDDFFHSFFAFCFTSLNKVNRMTSFFKLRHLYANDNTVGKITPKTTGKKYENPVSKFRTKYSFSAIKYRND